MPLSPTCEWRPRCDGARIGIYRGVVICSRCYQSAARAGATVSVTEVLRQARLDAW